MNAINFKSSNRTRILRWIGTVSSMVLLWYLIKKQGWNEIRTAFHQINTITFIYALILIFVSRFAVIGRWHVLIRSVQDVSLWETIRLSFAGMFATNFLPTTIGGDVVRLAGAIQLEFDGTVSAASLVVDRLIGMFGMFWALPFGAKPLIDWINFADIKTGGPVLGISFPWLGKLQDKTIKFLEKVVKALKVWLEHPKSLVLSFLFTLMHMVCLFSIIMLFLGDLGEGLPFSMVAGLWSFVYFLTLIPISINGYGVQELSIAIIFSEVGGVTLESGITVSVLLRTLMVIGSLPGSIFLPGILAGEKNQEKTPG